MTMLSVILLNRNIQPSTASFECVLGMAKVGIALSISSTKSEIDATSMKRHRYSMEFPVPASA